MMSTVKSSLEAAIGFFYPEVCQICRERQAGPATGYVCELCRKQIHILGAPYCQCCGKPYNTLIDSKITCQDCLDNVPGFDWARSAVVTNSFILDIVHQYKYNRALWFETLLGSMLVERTQEYVSGQKWDMIVPVPLHPVKYRERGFNQAERLGMWLSRSMECRLDTTCLERVVNTATQTRLSRKERMDNVARAFRLKAKANPAGKKVLLVDDVMTTGATTSECAWVLKQNGADMVSVCTVARGV